VPKNRFCPRRVGLSVRAFFAKKFSGAGEDFDRINAPMLACGTF
jgi:hypothetical protein